MPSTTSIPACSRRWSPRSPSTATPAPRESGSPRSPASRPTRSIASMTPGRLLLCDRRSAPRPTPVWWTSMKLERPGSTDRTAHGRVRAAGAGRIRRERRARRAPRQGGRRARRSGRELIHDLLRRGNEQELPAMAEEIAEWVLRFKNPGFDLRGEARADVPPVDESAASPRERLLAAASTWWQRTATGPSPSISLHVGRGPRSGSSMTSTAASRAVCCTPSRGYAIAPWRRPARPTTTRPSGPSRCGPPTGRSWPIWRRDRRLPTSPWSGCSGPVVRRSTCGINSWRRSPS